MPNTKHFAMLVPQEKFAARMNTFLNSELIPDVYPDKYIKEWGIETHSPERARLEVIWEQIEKGEIEAIEPYIVNGSKYKGFEITIGPWPLNEFPNHAYQNVALAFSVELQTSDYFTDLVFLHIHFQLSSPSAVNNHHPTRFVLQKIVNLLQPYYCWITNDYELDLIAKNKIKKPWTTYSPTMVFGHDFIEDYEIGAFLHEASFYYKQPLNNGIIWLGDVVGLGNENPAYYEFLLRGDIKTWFTYYDDSLQKIVDSASEMHVEEIQNLLTLITN